jgi:RNA polymerase sigma factor (sigma-70 family)
MDETQIKKIIDDTAKATAKETVREMIQVKKQSRNKKTFRDVIELLESIPDLKDKLEQDDLDIADMKREKTETNTWHDIKKPGGPVLDDNIRQLQKIRNRERAQKRTENLLRRIEKVLQKVKTEDGYEILEMRYLKGMTMEQISEELHYSIRTISRKHNKIVTKLKRKLFGADAMDIWGG